MDLSSWSGIVARPEHIWSPSHRYELSVSDPGWSALGSTGVIHGGGRSYSDIALPSLGAGVLRTNALCHVVSFDRLSGVMEVEAGVSLSTIQALALPEGWGLSVMPGTSQATAGGAFSNDVHGKNHASVGAFSQSVLSINLYRSKLGLIRVDRSLPELWAATVGGLGATGLIVTLTLQLTRWASSVMEIDQIRFVGLQAFLDASMSEHEYVVGWLDTFSSPVRGVVFRGKVCDDEDAPIARNRVVSLRLPQIKVINSAVSRAFNVAYWIAHPNAVGIKSGWESFFCPLDKIENWNRLYGARGFSQFQCVIPTAVAVEAYEEIFEECRQAGQGSFLSVIKKFGDMPSEGYLSFARPGVTFAMDFPNQSGTRELFSRLTRIAMQAGGALYPAKMSIESIEDFTHSFPKWSSWRAQWDDDGVFANSAWIARLGLKGME